VAFGDYPPPGHLLGDLGMEAELTTAEMLRAVCNEPPRNPVPAEALGWRLDTDLDAILLKALRKEPPSW